MPNWTGFFPASPGPARRHNRRHMIKGLSSAAAIYLLLLAALYLMQRTLIYLPDGHRPQPSAFGIGEMSVIELTTDDGLELVAWWRPPQSASLPVVVYYHGNAGHIGYRGSKIRPYLDRGWGVLLTTWRGYSGNPGSPDERGLYADGRAALQFLATEGVSPARTVLYGESLGGGVAVELAVDFRAGAVVLESPFTSIADVAARQFFMFPVGLLVRDRFDNLNKIARVRSPLLVVHGEKDMVVPVRHGRRLLDAANPPRSGKFIPRAGHNDLYAFAVADMVIDFVESTVEK